MKKQFVLALVLSLVMLVAGAGMVMAADKADDTKAAAAAETKIVVAEVTIEDMVTKTDTGFMINEYVVLEMDLTDLVGKKVTVVGVPAEKDGKKVLSIVTIEEKK